MRPGWKVHLEVSVAPDWLPLAPWTAAMMGGTEALAVRLARGLAASGHDVTFRGGLVSQEDRGVRYLSAGAAPPAPDRLICVNASAPLDVQSDVPIYWSHAAQLPMTGSWSRIVAVSEYHARLLLDRLPGSPVVALPAGAEPPAGERAVQPDRFLYGSSPDRGLHRLLRIWPALWGRFGRPLSITYDVRAVLRRRGGANDALGARLREIARLLDQPGVVIHGPLSAIDVAELRARSLAYLYPLDPVLPHSELYALAVLDAAATGVPLVLSPVDCFPDEYADAARFVEGQEPEAWADAIAEVLHSGDQWSERARAHARRRSSESWLNGWLELLDDPGPLWRCDAGVLPDEVDMGANSARPAWRPPPLYARA